MLAAAVRHLVGKGSGAALPGTVEIHLVNVQPALPGDITRFVSREQVEGYHRDESAKELAEARALLDASGARYRCMPRWGRWPKRSLACASASAATRS